MTIKTLKIKAGPTAKKILLERGLLASDVKIIAAAAGGPKWMTLYPLYKYIFGEWLHETQHEINLIGASAGAWSMACACQVKPEEAFQNFLSSYAEQKYPTAPTTTEVSESCKTIINNFLGKKGADNILNHKRYNLSVITSPSKFTYHEKSLKRKLFIAAGMNLLSRKNLGRYFERNIFSRTPIDFVGSDGIPSTNKKLNTENLKRGLLASGAIPTVIDPIEIDNQTHWDGGITDYHLDLNYKLDQGIILYPHFHHTIIPGWLDKYVKLRKPNKNHHDRTVLIYPSEEFIASLPMKKIPTRDDFKTYFQKDDERIRLWYETIDRCYELVEDFKNLLSNPILPTHISNF